MLNLVGPVSDVQNLAEWVAWVASVIPAVFAEKPKLRLYQNDLIPTKNTVVGDFVESTFPGYSFVELQPLSWGPAVEMPDGSFIAAYLVVPSFVRSAGAGAPEPVFGAYMVDANGGLVASVRIGSPVTIVALNDFVNVELALTAKVASLAAAADMTSNAALM